MLLTSAIKHFCSGQDLDEHGAAMTPAQAALNLRRGAAAIIAILRCKAPIVVSVRGAAIGAGALLACSADVFIASEDCWR